MLVNIEAVKNYIAEHENKSELARVSGIDRPYLYRVLNGERNPGVKFIEGLIRSGMARDEIFN